jgi:diaminohydroxyphosphoribosylaminopyrimidine deaminase / 5-amino-6-(5-phosphoribosylamino)uracil reductase
MFTEFDRLAMTRALALAERGLETTHPNPRVGCVIAKGDRIIAEGWHERAGEAHAEVAAIRAAKEPVAGSTAYVTLEPCSHHGRTPPCVNALIEARVARVVFAVQDPNPRVSGRGADALLRAGITVEAGLMQTEATELNIGFMKRMREGRPWVRVKLAMSLDGRTALANGASQWITSEAARNDVQRWRARSSAVMTGVGTVLADDPQLNVRVPGFKGRQPLRVALDARLRSPVGARMFVGLGAGAGLLAGEVLIFTATGGGVSAAGPAQAAAPGDPAALAGDMAELVSAFEMSPTSVAARSADLVGPVSVKAETPVRERIEAAAVVKTRAAAGAEAPVPVAGPGSLAGDRGAASGATGMAPVSSVPPTLAAAAAVSGVSTPADDATWAGAALSGAIPVKSDERVPTAVSVPASDGRPLATAAGAPASPALGTSAGPAAAIGGPTPTEGAATPVAAARPIGKALSPVPIGTPPPGAAAKSPGVGPSGAPASGVVVTGATSTRALTSAAAGAALRGGTPVEAGLKADTSAALQARRVALLARGVQIEEVAADDGFLDLFAVLQKLAELEVNEVLVEAGPTLAGQLFTTFLADELLLYIAPKLLGPQGRPLVNLPELQSLQDAWGFALFDAKRFGDDLRLRMRPK